MVKIRKINDNNGYWWINKSSRNYGGLIVCWRYI